MLQGQLRPYPPHRGRVTTDSEEVGSQPTPLPDQSVCPVSRIFTTCNSYTWYTSFDIIIVQVYMFHCSNHNKIQQKWMTRRNGLKNASFKLSFSSPKPPVPTIDWAVLVVRRPSFFEYFDWWIEKFLVSIQPNPHGHPRPNCVSSVTSGHWRAQQLANLKCFQLLQGK